MFFEQKLTFESTFNKEISSIFIDFLTLEEVFFKFKLLNRDYNHLVESLKNYDRVWKIKYIQEFVSNEDRKRKKYASPEA